MARFQALILALLVTSCGTYQVPQNYNYNQSIPVSPRVNKSDICSVLHGALVVSNDGKYLGRITNRFDVESIINEFGSFGSEFSSTSIWNKFGSYGGEFSQTSPFNRYSTTPPTLVKNGVVIGFLSVNTSLLNSVNPFVIKSCDY